MDAAHVHLVLNHVPVVGTIVGLLLLGAGLMRRSDELKRASLTIFIASALLAIPTYFTGESAEHLVEPLSGVSESLIERHEDAAFLSVVALEILGFLAAATLVLARSSGRLASPLVTAALLLSIATGGLMARTANLGGQIRHPEIRTQAAIGSPTAGLRSQRSHDRD